MPFFSARVCTSRRGSSAERACTGGGDVLVHVNMSDPAQVYGAMPRIRLQKELTAKGAWNEANNTPVT